MYRKMKNQLYPPPLYKCIVVLLAAAALMLTACSGLQEDGGNGNVTITLPNVGGRSISADDIGRLERATASYRVHMNDRVLEGTGGKFSAYFAVGLKVDIYVECLNSSRDVIVRTGVKTIVVNDRGNDVHFNLKTDGNEIIPPAPQPVPNQVTYDWGEASRHGTKGVLPSPVAVVAGGVFTVDDGTNMTWQHATQPAGFTGWSASPAIEPANGGQATNAPISGDDYKMPDGGVVLTAQWNKRQYQITYHANEPEDVLGNKATVTGVPQQPTSVTALDSASVFSGQDPTSSQFDGKNWTFTGWNTQADGGGTTYSAGQQIQMMTDNIDLYARWTSANVYTVTYSMGSGPSSADIGWRDNDKYTVGTSPAITLPTLTATGYDFMGWQIDGESNNRGGGTSYTPNASVTATAQWNIKTYTLTYSAGDGVNNASNIPAQGTGFQHGVAKAISGTQPTRTGYKFLGWADASGAASATYTAGGNITLTGAKTIYAVWETAYTLTLNLNGGSWANASDNKTQYSASELPLTLPTSTAPDSNFTFVGWSDNTNLSGTVTAIPSGTTGNKTYYAVYKTNSTSNAASNIALGSQKTIEFVAVQGGSVPLTANYMPVVSNFSMSKHEITRGQWNEVMGSQPTGYLSTRKSTSGIADNNPMITSWYDAIAFCNKLSIKEGKTPCYSVTGVDFETLQLSQIPTNDDTNWENATCNWNANGYRLPTEAEWEYAARGGVNHSPYKYSGSDNVDEVAWPNPVQEVDPSFAAMGITPNPQTNEVGNLQPNALDIYDMSGNANEWCWDRLKSNTYVTTDTINPTGIATADDAGSTARVVRGFSTRVTDDDRFSVSARDSCNPYQRRGDYSGFRIVCRP